MDRASTLLLAFVVALGSAACAGPHAPIVLGHAHVTPEGAALGAVRVGLSSWSRANGERPLDSSSVVLSGDEAHIDHGDGVVEWWRREGSGLEQGVTIASRLAGEGELVLVMATNAARVEARDDDELALLDEDGRALASYASLSVLDADGAHVPARMRGDGTRIRISVDDRSARYPIVVDPILSITQEALLAPSSGTLFNHVAITADGTRVLVGTPSTNSAHVFVRNGVTWTEEAVLTRTGAAVGEMVGTELALSDDGTIALIASGSSFTATVAVLTRVGSTWTQTGSFSAIPANLALSGDGSHAAGGTSIYVASGGTYVSQASLPSGTTLCSTGPVAFARDASRVALGCPTAGAANPDGAVTVFARSGTTWSFEQAMLGMTNGSQRLGGAIDISDDGSRIAAGSSQFQSVTVFLRTGTSWTTEATITRATSGFSSPLALSGDGLVLFVGAPGGTNTPAYSYVRAAGVWAADVSFNISTMGTVFPLGLATTANGGRVVGTDPSAGAAAVFHVQLPQGSACAVAADCANGLCVDGVCCNVACGGGVSDCQGCSNALTGGLDGTCAALSPSVAPMVTCRAAAGACDAAEVCSTSSMTCPADGFLSGVTCRMSAGVCDIVETCNGSSAACPADAFMMGNICRPSVGMCDVSETCSGSAAACPTDGFAPSTQTCRFPTALCDAPELCTGSAPDCPIDAIQPSGHVCHPSMGVCDPAEMCDGITTGCPTDARYPAGHVCAPAGSGVCDAPDVCDGMAATCQATYATGTVCRAAAGACDVAEACSGSSDACPPDGLLASGVVCRMSTASCDPAESCDGTSTSCPPDVSTCMPMPDAGVGHDASVAPIDGGTSVDAAVTSDAARDGSSVANDTSTSGTDTGATPPPTTGGCGCASVGSRDRWPSAWIVVLALLGVARRRRA